MGWSSWRTGRTGRHRAPHQIAAEVEARILELRRWKPYWGARKILVELKRQCVRPVPSESAVYRCLVRASLIDPRRSKRELEPWKRWERSAAMELWQMDVVGGFLMSDGTAAEALTGVDDHSRFCVSARLMPRERTQLVCDGLSAAFSRHGVPEQILTDNGKVFHRQVHAASGRGMFERICRENGVEHLLTGPGSPTTTGKVERFHRTLRLEVNTTQVFTTLRVAQQVLDEWVTYYNTKRPHQSVGDTTPARRFEAIAEVRGPRSVPERGGDQWVTRKVSATAPSASVGSP